MPDSWSKLVKVSLRLLVLPSAAWQPHERCLTAAMLIRGAQMPAGYLGKFLLLVYAAGDKLLVNADGMHEITCNPGSPRFMRCLVRWGCRWAGPEVVRASCSRRRAASAACCVGLRAARCACCASSAGVSSCRQARLTEILAAKAALHQPHPQLCPHSAGMRSPADCLRSWSCRQAPHANRFALPCRHAHPSPACPALNQSVFE